MKKRILSTLLTLTFVMSSFAVAQPTALAWQTDLPTGTEAGSGGGGGTGGGTGTEFHYWPDSSTIKDGETDVPSDAVLMLMFSNNVSGEEVLDQNAAKIKVTDAAGAAVDFTVTSVPEGKEVPDLFLYRRYLSINIKNWKSEETYTITIAPGIQAKNGNALTEGYTLRFTTAKEDATTKIIELNKAAAYLSGYEDDTMRPDAEITRAEVSTILTKIIQSAPDATKPAVVTDASDGWYKDYVTFALNKGLMNGYEDGTFRPNAKMTRAEFVTAIRKLTDPKTGAIPFTDVGDHWAATNIASGYINNLIKGYEDGTFRPDKTITRAEVASIINKVIDKQVNLTEKQENIKTFTDLTQDHWGYESLITATLN